MLRGVTANMIDIDTEEVGTGRYVTDADDQHRANVIMIGTDIAKRFFSGVDPLGRTLYIDGEDYEVIGVSKEIGTAFGQSQDDFVYIPIETLPKRLRQTGKHEHQYQGAGRGPDGAGQDESRMLMRARHHLTAKQDDKFGIIEPSAIMELYKQPHRNAGQRLNHSGFHFSGDWRHRDHEHHAGQRDRKNAGDRRPQITGRNPARHPSAISG